MPAPTFIVAGDTTRWSDSLPAYPASAGWVLKHRLAPLGTGAPVDVVATPDGDDFTTTLAASVTGGMGVGQWTLASWVENGAEVFTIATRVVDVKRNPRDMGAGTDGRSPARRALDDARAAFYAFDPTRRRYKIGEREFEFHNTGEILLKIRELENIVRAEDEAAGIAPRRSHRIFTRL
jgi:hypothetical protein